MSKSDPQGCLFLDDSPETVLDKLKRAVTDSGSTIFYDPENKPAVANLLRIWMGMTGQSQKEAEEYFGGKSYADFKVKLAEVIIEKFAPFRAKKSALLKKPGTLKRILKEGSEAARKVADKKLTEAKKRMGIIV